VQEAHLTILAESRRCGIPRSAPARVNPAALPEVAARFLRELLAARDAFFLEHQAALLLRLRTVAPPESRAP
jgi:hypothetical protein